MNSAPQLLFELDVPAAQESWTATLELAREQASGATYESWLKDLRLVRYAEGELVVAAPNEFRRNWVEKKYASLLARCAEGAFGSRPRMRFVTECPSDDTNSHVAAAGAKGGATRRIARPEPRERIPDEAFFGTVPLNPRYTFDTFVIGHSNRLAHAGAVAAAERPAGAYNPLFIHGGAGLGKTHLMHALGHAARSADPRRRIAYLSAEQFTTNYVSAIRERKMDEFRRRYRQADVWLVDDIQFIADKERTEEEFFHTFNALSDLGKQIVLTSDRPPKDLHVDERLRSRFEAGLIADIRPPELETRVAILQQKASLEHTTIPDDVLLYMAELIQSNIRVLEGALIKLLAYASISHSPITQQMAGDVLGAYFADRSGGRRGLQPEDVKRLVARAFGVSVEDINGTSRSKGIVLARQVAMHLIRELTGASLPEIGRQFGGKDHTTVVHACRKIKALLEADLQVARQVASITAELKAVAC
jgi:chromosomal replication initiator protein